MTKILVLENDAKLERSRHHYVMTFLENYTGEVIDFSHLHSKSNTEIWVALNECTDIITQTCFINGSDSQFYSFLRLLTKIKETKNIYIALLGSSLQNWFEELDPSELYDIKQHNIYELGYDGTTTKLSFAHITMPILRQLVTERIYKREGLNRLTGDKVRVLGCNAVGEAFEGLKIGEIVPVVDMSELDPNSKRGVWIMGNGEPIKLVNDCGLQEYELVNPTVLDVVEEIFKLVGGIINGKEVVKDEYGDDTVQLASVSIDSLTAIEVKGYVSLIEDEEMSAMDKANMICEELNIPKRGNRQNIYNLINKFGSVKI